MAKFRVWNDNDHDYREMFKGDEIKIKAHGFVDMEEDDAFQFKGTYSPPVLNTDGVHMPQGFKKIRIQAISAETAKPVLTDELACIACKYKADSKADLTEHTKAAHADQITVDEQAEAELKKRKKVG